MVCYPEITRSIKSEGHQIAIHGFEHTFVINKKDSWIIQDVMLWKEAYHSISGESMDDYNYYRPPYGLLQKSRQKLLTDHNLMILPLSFYAMDAESGPSRMSRVINLTVNGILSQNGGVIVLHDGKDLHSSLLETKNPHSKYNRSWIPDAADSIISTLKKLNFNFCLLGDFCNYRV